MKALLPSCVPASAAALCALASLSLPPAAAAQPPTEPGWTTSIRGAYARQLDAGIDGGGDVGVGRYFVQPSLTHTWAGGHSASLALGYGRDAYEFDGAGFGGGNAWDDVESVRLSAPLRWRQNDRLTWFGVPTLRFSAETDADLGDGATAGVIAGVSYRYSDSLTIGPGIGVFGQIEDDVTFIPILLVNWQMTDRFSLRTGSGIAATGGPGLTLAYRYSPKLELGLTGRYDSHRFRLDDGGPAPDGVGEETSAGIYASVSYRVSPTIGVSGFAGAAVGGELRLEDRNGRRLQSADYDTAAVLGVTANASF